MHDNPRRRTRLLACGAALTLLPAFALPAVAAEQVQLDQTKKTYIVQLASAPIAGYEGGVAGIPATAPDAGAKVNARSANAKKYEAHLRNEQRQALRDAKVGERAKKHEYTVAFNGFAAELTQGEADLLKNAKGVVQVWEDELRYADTTTTPDNPSFAALPEDVNAPAGFTCDTGADTAFTCNNKLVGARYYGAEFGNTITYDHNSPRDANGHGSHTAGTAAGNHGVPVTVLGNDMGRASGMAPAAQIAVYKGLWMTKDGRGSGTTSGLVAAINHAVADGVDVINYSISGSSTSVVGPDEIAFLNAASAGVFVATSAGNSGDEGPSTVAHNSPWTTTVAASTHDRSVANSITLGNRTTYAGVGYGGPTEQTPMVLARDIPAAGATPAQADLCGTGTVDDEGANGKIVVCTRGTHAFVDKGAEVKASGGAGIVVANAPGGASTLVPIMYGFPGVHVTAADGAAIAAYVSANTEPTGAIDATTFVKVDAPAMASFSSYGPALAGGGDLVKPDITAPGVDILAATAADPETGEARFESMQGTSMSAPHIAGLAALMKQKFPRWSPMAIKSAMMTTARQTTDAGEPIMHGSTEATPFNYGAGEVVPRRMYNPGLVFDSTTRDWIGYACGIGQDVANADGSSACTGLEPKDPSDLNYPTIGVGELAGSQVVTRRVTNVTNQRLQFVPQVEAPAGFKVNVTPKRLNVPAGKTAQFKVEFTRTDAPLGQWVFGAVTWKPLVGSVEPVRSAIAVRPVAVAAPAEVIGSGVAGSAEMVVTPGFSGTLGTDVDGLLASTITPTEVIREEGTPLDGYIFFEVKEGTRVTRVATYGDEVAAQDIDLYLYRLDLATNTVSFVTGSGNEGSTEEVTVRDLAPGLYVASIDLYSEEPTVTVPIHVWNLDDTSAGNLTVDPASATVTMGQPSTFTAAWSGLDATQKYLGQVNYLQDGTIAGSTLVTVNP